MIWKTTTGAPVGGAISHRGRGQMGAIEEVEIARSFDALSLHRRRAKISTCSMQKPTIRQQQTFQLLTRPGKGHESQTTDLFGRGQVAHGTWRRSRRNS
jgi:hypothetical protein